MYRRSILVFAVISFCTMLPAQAIRSVSHDSAWVTYFENSGYKGTPSYQETMEYLQKYENEFPEVEIINFGISPQGRDLKCVIVSKEKAFTPEAARLIGKPVVMISSGIHGGEIEGKDASLLLLRELLVTGEKKYLLDSITIMMVPIFNVDGHERRSMYNRINQDGPEEMGWRTTSQNLNLNRDWMKADAPEMRSMLELYNGWLPDFLIDSHTTDGADYQYTVTVALEKYSNIYHGTAVWNKYTLFPYIQEGVEHQGFLISPYVIFRDDMPDSGLVEYPAPPMLSTGYAAVQNRPALLIETHMMKPYKDRVFATKAVFNSILQYIFENPEQVIALNKEADQSSIEELVHHNKYFPVAFKTVYNKKEFLYKGIEAVRDASYISGALKTVYTGRKYQKRIPYYDSAYVADSVAAPKAFLIPVEWSHLADILKLHGVKTKKLGETKKYWVKRYKFKNIKYVDSPYEGRFRVKFDFDTYFEHKEIPSGTILVPVEQRSIRVILHLLHPGSDYSFVRWGFMNAIFERKEYYEPYVMEKVAVQMLKDDPGLMEEFEDRLSTDDTFKESPSQRLNFFYERSPYYDKNYMVYPIMILE